jgi:hypothetical protein
MNKVEHSEECVSETGFGLLNFSYKVQATLDYQGAD